MPFAANINYSLSFQGSGGGIPVVLIHGAGGSHLYWPSGLRRLMGYRVYAIDLPGHGKSAGHGLQSIEKYADKIVDWLGDVGLHRAIFVGHSMGGAIALTLADKYPEHVLGLGLISTGAQLKVNQELIDNLINQQTFTAAISFIITYSFHQKTNPKIIELAQKRLSETRSSVLHGDFIACNKYDLSDKLSDINFPTLIICGAEDKMTPPRYSQFLMDSLPNAIFQVCQNAGHMVMLEKPQQVGKILDSFLSRIPFNPGKMINN